jgi:hypothetical protein
VLVVDFGDDEHGEHAQQRKSKLPLEKVQRVSLGVDGGVQVIHGRGIGGGQHHDEPHGGEQHHQRQKGQVDGPPGQLLLDGQIPLCFSGHGPLLLPLSSN